MKANLRQQLEAFDKGIFLDSSGKIDKFSNFYDWFCKDSSLKRKAEALYPKVKKFLKHNPTIDTEKTYVFFKNNCPGWGSLYDDFRICDIETGNVIFTVIPKTGHKNVSPDEKAAIWGRSNNFKGAIKTAPTYTLLLKK